MTTRGYSITGAETRKYIALHPFTILSGRDPADDAIGPFSVTPNGEVWGQAPSEIRNRPMTIKRPITDLAFTKRLRTAAMMKTAASKVPWGIICQEIGLRSIADIQRGLAAIHVETNPLPKDRAILTKITDYCDRQKIFFPIAGSISPTLERSIGKILEKLSLASVQVTDEDGFHQLVVESKLFLEPEPLALELTKHLPKVADRALPINWLQSPQDEFEVYVAEGTSYSIISVSDKHIEPFIQTELEGFWCDPNRTFDWWFTP